MIQVIDKAVVPEKKVKPMRLLIVMVSVFCGFFLSARGSSDPSIPYSFSPRCRASGPPLCAPLVTPLPALTVPPEAISWIPRIDWLRLRPQSALTWNLTVFTSGSGFATNIIFANILGRDVSERRNGP